MLNKEDPALKKNGGSRIKGGEFENYFKFSVPEMYCNHKEDGIKDTLQLKILKKKQEDVEKCDAT
jgi:hypothetical protein